MYIDMYVPASIIIQQFKLLNPKSILVIKYIYVYTHNVYRYVRTGLHNNPTTQILNPK
jgi:hypothetical protein